MFKENYNHKYIGIVFMLVSIKKVNLKQENLAVQLKYMLNIMKM